MHGEAGTIAFEPPVVATASGCVVLALAQDFPHSLLQVLAQVLVQLLQPKGIVICLASGSVHTSEWERGCPPRARLLFMGDSIDWPQNTAPDKTKQKMIRFDRRITGITTRRHGPGATSLEYMNNHFFHTAGTPVRKTCVTEYRVQPASGNRCGEHQR